MASKRATTDPAAPAPLLSAIRKRARERSQTVRETEREFRIRLAKSGMVAPPVRDTLFSGLPVVVRARICVAFYDAEDAAMDSCEPKADWPNTPANERKNKAYCTRWNRWRDKQLKMLQRTMQVAKEILGEASYPLPLSA